MRFDKVAVIGFGEAGPIFAKAFLDAGAARVSAYDILIDDPATAAAERAAGSMAPGQIYLDLNSTSPRVKREAARAIEAAGASFIEGVAMDTVPNFGARVPLLIAGPGADALAGELGEVGLNVECAGPELGQASSAKMLRSVLIKGFAALFAESMLAAGKLGLERRVVDSLAVTFPGLDWPAVIAHYLGRSAVHAKRQAAEMHASAETVEDLGVEPIMARAIAARLDLAASLDLVSHYEVRENPEIDDYLRAVAAAEHRSRK